MPSNVQVTSTASPVTVVEQAEEALYCGMEFEFASRDRDRIIEALVAADIPVHRRGMIWNNRNWNLGSDPSVLESRRRNRSEGTRPEHQITYDWYGAELRTPKFDPDDPDMLVEIERALTACQQAGGLATRTSGMHIHISCQSDNREVDPGRLSRLVESAFRRFVLRDRSHYCGPGCGEYKDRAVRIVDGNHIEIRIFNGTLVGAKAIRRLKKVVSMYRRSLLACQRSYV